MFDIKTGEVFKQKDKNKFSIDGGIKIKNVNEDFSNEFNDKFINYKNQEIKVKDEDFIDKEIFEKFLMFLQFQEIMKTRN